MECPKCGKDWCWDWCEDVLRDVDGKPAREEFRPSDDPNTGFFDYFCPCGLLLFSTPEDEMDFLNEPPEWENADWEEHAYEEDR